MTSRRDVQNFIKLDLKPKIARDLRNLRIINEADLQSSVYRHLRKYLSRDKRWKILNKPRERVGGKNARNLYPDLLLAVKKPRIGIELKEKSKVTKTTVLNDAKKLIELKKHKIIKHGFIIYLYRNMQNESELQEQTRQWLGDDKKDVDCIVISTYEHVPRKQWKKWTRSWEKYRGKSI